MYTTWKMCPRGTEAKFLEVAVCLLLLMGRSEGIVLNCVASKELDQTSFCSSDTSWQTGPEIIREEIGCTLWPVAYAVPQSSILFPLLFNT